MSTLQDRLGEVMDAKKWTRRDLVRVSGQSSSVVSQWLGKGSKIIGKIGKLEAAEALARASGFSALWIATGSGPRHPPPTRGNSVLLSAQEVAQPVYHVSVRDALDTIATALGTLARPQRDEVSEVFALVAKHPDRGAYIDLLAGMLATGGSAFTKRHSVGG